MDRRALLGTSEHCGVVVVMEWWIAIRNEWRGGAVDVMIWTRNVVYDSELIAVALRVELR